MGSRTLAFFDSQLADRHALQISLWGFLGTVFPGSGLLSTVSNGHLDQLEAHCLSIAEYLAPWVVRDVVREDILAKHDMLLRQVALHCLRIVVGSGGSGKRAESLESACHRLPARGCCCGRHGLMAKGGCNYQSRQECVSNQKR